MEQSISRNEAISALVKSLHGDLAAYAAPVARADPEFLAHLIAWNAKKGTIRDSKVALPVLAYPRGDAELRENALAHFGGLGLREMERSLRFAFAQSTIPHRPFSRIVGLTLAELEEKPGKLDRLALQHRKVLQSLYALSHTKAGPLARAAVFGQGPKSSLRLKVGELALMSDAEAAGTIVEHRIPFLIARGALGARIKSPTLLCALVAAMSPTEFVTNMKAIESLGGKENPALRAAIQAKVEEVGRSKAALLKTTKAAEVTGSEALRGAQERQIASARIEGNWLILADRSGSMSKCIEASRHVAATLAKFAKGQVRLTFFNAEPQSYDVSGKSYDEILELTKRIRAEGGTSISCGLLHAADFDFNGIATVSDGGENRYPTFAQAYMAHVERTGKTVPVYLYEYRGDPNVMKRNCEALGVPLEIFPCEDVDYYSIPTLVQTMRTNRFSLADEIMQTPLLRLADIFSAATLSKGKPCTANFAN